MIYYHGTIVSNLSKFEINLPNIGECIEPVNGIWLCSDINGASWHANRVKNIRDKEIGYVYEVEFFRHPLVIVNALDSKLSDEVYCSYLKSFSVWKRIFLSNSKWYYRFEKAANRKFKGHSDEKIRNEIIRISLACGIDGIINPLVSLNIDGTTNNHNDGVYGTTLLLINLNCKYSIKLVHTV